ncbi:hypothetical protein GCM10027589_02190 [Actinocorallia lasiicapitis]
MKVRLTSLTAVAALALSVMQAPVAHASVPAEAAAVPAVAAAKAAAKRYPGNRIGWAYVNKATPKKTYVFKKTPLPIGKKGKNLYRSFLRMDLSSATEAVKIKSVKLTVPVKTPNPCVKSKNYAVQVFIVKPLTKKATWKNQPKSLGKRWQWLKPKCSGKRLEVDVTRPARALLNNDQTSISIGLRADSEKDARKYMTFGRDAKLVIKATYESGNGDPGTGPDPSTNKPNAVVNATAGGQGCAVGANRPKFATGDVGFSGTVSDADGGFVRLRAEYRKKGALDAKALEGKQKFTDQNQAVTSTAGVAGLENAVYEWRVQAADDVAGGAWSGWCEFEVAVPVAAAPPAAPVELKLIAGGVEYPCGAVPTVPEGVAVTASAKVVEPNGDKTMAHFAFQAADGALWKGAGAIDTGDSVAQVKTVTVPAAALTAGLNRMAVYAADKDGKGPVSATCEYKIA